MTKLEIAKKAVSFTVGFGTSAIVGNIIKNNAAPGNLPEKVAMPIAAVALGMMMSEIAGKYTDAKLDELADWWVQNVKKD